jgi:hypothetical protein
LMGSVSVVSSWCAKLANFSDAIMKMSSDRRGVSKIS